MGLIYEYAKSLGLIASHPAEQKGLTNATAQVGKRTANIVMAQVSAEEVSRLFSDIDMQVRDGLNQEAAKLIAAASPTILAALREVKNETGSEYGGQRGVGTELVATLVRGVHIGNTDITNTVASATAKGLYGGTNAAVYSWLPTTNWTAGTAKTILPSQQMAKDAAMVAVGYVEPSEIPKVDGYRWTLAGQTTPVLPLVFEMTKRTNDRDATVGSFVEPVYIGPKQTFAHDLYPHKTGAAEPRLIAVLIAMAKYLTA